MNLMALIRMFTIRFRMEGAIGVVLLLLGLLGGVGMWSMLRIYDLHQDFMQVPWQQNQQLQQMQSKLDALQLKEKEVLITFSRSANLDDSYSQWKADVQAVQGQMQQISQTIDASQKTNLEKLGQSVQAYVDGFGPLVQSLQANPYVSVEETLEAANVPYQHLLAAQQALGALQMQLHEQAQAFEAKGASVKDEAQWLFLAAVLLTLLVVGPLTWMNMLAICRPLAQAQKLAKAIAMGDLTQSIEIARGKTKWPICKEICKPCKAIWPNWWGKCNWPATALPLRAKKLPAAIPICLRARSKRPATCSKRWLHWRS